MREHICSRKGFTLIELLIVVAIIGILAAVAIPQFSAYRTKAYNSAALSDVTNVTKFMESYFADSQAYPTGAYWINNVTTIGTNTFAPSKSVAISTNSVASSYCAVAAHWKGNFEYGACRGTGITGSYSDTTKIYSEPYSSGALASANPTSPTATQLQGTAWQSL